MSEDFSIFSKSAARVPEPVVAPTPVPEPLPAPPPIAAAPVAAQQSSASCLIAGPVSSGKSAFVSVVCDACAGDPSLDMILKAVPEEEMVKLMEEGGRRRSNREGLDASLKDREYRFWLSAERRVNGWRSASKEFLGVRQFLCMDGPGGALFSEDPDPATLAPPMRSYRDKLLGVGRSAETLVFFLNVVDHRTATLVSANLARIMYDLSTEMRVPFSPPTAEHQVATRFPWNRRPAASTVVPPAAPLLTTVRKVNATRVLLVLNFLDQLCMDWKLQWMSEQNELGNATPYEIATQYARPMEIVDQLMGRSFLRKLEGYLRPDAQLAVGLCSCGGFDIDSGDPRLNQMGEPNLPQNLGPRSRDQHTTYFGVREILTYAGFGILKPGIVEVVTQDYLYPTSRSMSL